MTRGEILSAAARGLALFAGLLTLAGVFARLRGFDANGWWVDLRPLPAWISTVLLTLAGGLLAAWSVRPDAAPWRTWTTAVVLVGLTAAALGNALQYWLLLGGGAIRSGFPLPFSLAVAVTFGFLVVSVLRPAPTLGVAGRAAFVAAVAVSALLLPALQIACFGSTDYARRADAAIVFGARAYASGRPSPALHDRVTTAVALYRAGTVRTLVFSGAEGDGDVHETESMRRLALSMGVPDEAIVVDRNGENTAATVAHTVPLMRERGWRRVLAVSHDYHLPRVKLCYQAAGVEVFTVPARESRPLARKPWFIVRELAALWAYGARAAVAPRS